MQNLSNHRRFSPIHHFFLTPLLITLFVWSIVYCVQNGFSFPTIYFLVGSFILNLITLISRSYALKNQDRIIRIEMRFRYFELTGNSFSDKEKHLKIDCPQKVRHYLGVFLWKEKSSMIMHLNMNV